MEFREQLDELNLEIQLEKLGADELYNSKKYILIYGRDFEKNFIFEPVIDCGNYIWDNYLKYRDIVFYSNPINYSKNPINIHNIHEWEKFAENDAEEVFKKNVLGTLVWDGVRVYPSYSVKLETLIDYLAWKCKNYLRKEIENCKKKMCSN